MGLRRAHGTARACGAIAVTEAPPWDELPAGVQVPAQAPTGDERRPDGTFAPGARTLQALGGRATAGKTRLADRMGLRRLPEGAAFAPYKAAAVSFRRAQCAELARTVGGGRCGAGPSSIVASAALSLAWSRYLSDLAAETGDPELAVKACRLGDSSRAALRDAHALCALEAQARPRAPIDLASALADGEEPLG